MQSLHGIYENGKITLLYRLPKTIPESANVLVTFVIDENTQETLVAAGEMKKAKDRSKEDKGEAYYQSIREFERVKAHGNITVIDQDQQYTYPLNDYSQGGLSFIAKKQLNIGHLISAGITDPSNPELVLMELQMEVRGIIKMDENRFRIGCMFLDPVDEDLWHGLLQYLS